MKIKTFISLTVACVLLIGFFVGVRFQAFRAGRQAAPAEEDTSAYGERFARAARLLSANTLAVSDVADAVSQSWIQAVALGLDSSSQVEKVFAELEESGVRPKLARAHEELTQQMQDLKVFPFSFRTSFNVLERTYSVYAQLYKLALHPTGSLVIFNRNVGDLQEELARDFNRLALYTPQPALTLPAQDAPQPQAPAGLARTAGDINRIVGMNEEQVRELFGSPLSEENAAGTGFTQRCYSYKGKDITVYYKKDVVSGWNE